MLAPLLPELRPYVERVLDDALAHSEMTLPEPARREWMLCLLQKELVGFLFTRLMAAFPPPQRSQFIALLEQEASEEALQALTRRHLANRAMHDAGQAIRVVHQTLSKLIRKVIFLAPRGICAQEQQRNILKFFHHLQARQEVNAIAREQALIEQDEVWLAHTKEFQGRHPIRSDDDVVASLLCKGLTKVQGRGKVLLDEK